MTKKKQDKYVAVTLKHWTKTFNINIIQIWNEEREYNGHNKYLRLLNG